MNDHNQTNQHDDDKISSLYKQGSVETPAEHINTKILNNARQQSTNIIHLPFRLLINTISSSRPLAVAAVVVISISIILQIQFDHPDKMMPETLQESSMQKLDDGIPTPEDSLLEEQTDLNSESESFSINKEAGSQEKAIENSKVIKPSKSKKILPFKADKSRAIQLDKQIEKNKVIDIRRKKKREQSLRKRKILEENKVRSMEKYFKSNPSAPLTSAVSSFSAVIDSCKTLTHSDCLSSNICVLRFTNEILICQKADNHCESNFIQKNDIANLCLKRNKCQFIKGECLCDDNGICQCKDNIIPSCQLISK